MEPKHSVVVEVYPTTGIIEVSFLRSIEESYFDELKEYYLKIKKPEPNVLEVKCSEHYDILDVLKEVDRIMLNKGEKNILYKSIYPECSAHSVEELIAAFNKP